MYLITALVCTAIGGLLFYLFRDRKALHLELLPIIFGAASLMWLVDAFYSLAKEGVFISFDDPIDGWISLWTILGGIIFWLLLSFIFNNNKKTIQIKENA